MRCATATKRPAHEITCAVHLPARRQRNLHSRRRGRRRQLEAHLQADGGLRLRSRRALAAAAASDHSLFPGAQRGISSEGGVCRQAANEAGSQAGRRPACPDAIRLQSHAVQPLLQLLKARAGGGRRGGRQARGRRASGPAKQPHRSLRACRGAADALHCCPPLVWRPQHQGQQAAAARKAQGRPTQDESLGGSRSVAGKRICCLAAAGSPCRQREQARIQGCSNAFRRLGTPAAGQHRQEHAVSN